MVAKVEVGQDADDFALHEPVREGRGAAEQRRSVAAEIVVAPPGSAPFLWPLNPFNTMQEQVTLECTEAKKEGKPASRYLTFRNKKTVTERIEKKKYNPFLKRHTLHKEIK